MKHISLKQFETARQLIVDQLMLSTALSQSQLSTNVAQRVPRRAFDAALISLRHDGTVEQLYIEPKSAPGSIPTLYALSEVLDRGPIPLPAGVHREADFIEKVIEREAVPTQ